MKLAGNIITYFGLFITFSTITQQHTFLPSWEPFSFSIALMGSLIGGGLAYLGYRISKNDFVVQATETDDFAGEVLQHIKECVQERKHSVIGSTPRFSLFLRQFKLGFERSESGGLSGFNWEAYARPGPDGFERILAEALAQTAPLIAIGMPGDIWSGRGQIAMNGEWQEIVAKAIELAEYVCVVPATSQGTLWEIQEIGRQKQLLKTLFIMPPILFLEDDSRAGQAENWERSCQVLGGMGINVPPYEPAGALFRISGRDMKELVISKGVSMHPDKLARQINALFIHDL